MFQRLFTKIAKGGTNRKSRFHDGKGNLLDLGGWPYLPISLATTVLRHTTGYRAPVPWLGFRALKKIERILTPTSDMVEYGSGMSTLWFAKRCRYVYSIESNRDWYELVGSDLARHNIANVELILHEDKHDYVSLHRFAEASLDFILIDGFYRSECAKNAISKIKRGGHIYLDNSDAKLAASGGCRLAEAIILEAIAQRNGIVEYLNDFAPGNFHVTQGLLARF